MVVAAICLWGDCACALYQHDRRAIATARNTYIYCYDHYNVQCRDESKPGPDSCREFYDQLLATRASLVAADDAVRAKGKADLQMADLQKNVTTLQGFLNGN